MVDDGIFHGGDEFNNSLVVLCFARGTLIETPEGPRFIETLKQGDLVNTLDTGAQRIRWVSSQQMLGTGRNAPVRIRAGALGNIRDLWVSQNHRILVRDHVAELLFGEQEVLTAAKFLVNGKDIEIVPQEKVEYFHFLFDEHQVVFAEGIPAESLYPGTEARSGLDDTECDEILAHCPHLIEPDNTPTIARYPLTRYEAELLTAA